MKTNGSTFFRSALLAFFFFGCTRQPMDGSRRGWDHMMGYGNYGGMFMWLIWIIIAGVIVYFVFQRSKKTGGLEAPVSETPTDILKNRYVKGEISKEKFERLKRDIES